MLTWCAWARNDVYVMYMSVDATQNIRRYMQTSQHIDDTSGHNQNVNFQITSDILLRALFYVCVRSFVCLIITVTFQHSMQSPHLQLIFFFVVDVVMHLFALFFHRICMICTAQIDIEMFSVHIIRCANRNKYQVFRWDTLYRGKKEEEKWGGEIAFWLHDFMLFAGMFHYFLKEEMNKKLRQIRSDVAMPAKSPRRETSHCERDFATWQPHVEFMHIRNDLHENMKKHDKRVGGVDFLFSLYWFFVRFSCLMWKIYL